MSSFYVVKIHLSNNETWKPTFSFAVFHINIFKCAFFFLLFICKNLQYSNFSVTVMG